MADFDKRAFAQRLAQLRYDRCWTLEEAMREIGGTRNNYFRWEHGEVLPNLAAAVKIAQVFNVSLDWLVGLKEGDDNK